MKPKVIWSRQAISSLEKVVRYLEKEWSYKEILQLELKINTLLEQLKNQPELFPPSSKYPHLRKALIDKNNYLIYKWNFSENVITIITFRGTKQKPIF